MKVGFGFVLFSAGASLFALGVGGAPTSSIPVPSSSSASGSSSTSSQSTAVPSPSSSPGTTLQRYPAPKNQSWCPSPIYCPGELLQTVQLAGLYEDSKTFVDKPTTKSEDEVLANFKALMSSSGGNNSSNVNVTFEALVNFVQDNFGGEGLDIEPATLTDFVDQPAFLDKVKEPVLQGWLKQVHSYWKDLARQNVKNQSCADCTSSLIPLNHTFIVPGGRFREAYYWDTYWAIIGLLTGGLQETTKGILQNFVDLIDQNGFIPNGGRVYYLDRSQPPLFTQMLYLYVTSTNDTAFLKEVISANDKELLWWDKNRTVEVTGPSGKKHKTHRYIVDSTAPRPESYVEDWETVNGPLDNPNLNLSIGLYSDLASGAESGMDYSGARWLKDPLANVTDTTASLRSINTNEQIPVDLESILYRDYRLIARMYDMVGNKSRKDYWNDRADKSKAAVLDLHWDKDALAFRDYNLTSGKLADVWSTAGYYPYWSEIIPDEVLQSETKAQKAFSGLAYITAHYNGSIPTTLIQTGQQWDFPNVWPPQVWISVKALQALPKNISSAAFGAFSRNSTQFSYLPDNHFALTQDKLPEQPVLGNEGSNITSVSSLTELGNVGNLTDGAPWRDALVDALVNRYMGSAFCSWYSTGGTVPGLLNQLSQEDLNLTNSAGGSGNMFEKFSTLDLDQAGAGGEYTPQKGFGWTNGVAVVWGRDFGDKLVIPDCPAIQAEASKSGDGSQSMHRDLNLRPNLAAKYVDTAEGQRK